MLSLIKKHAVDGLVLALLVWICTATISLQDRTLVLGTDVNWLKINQVQTNVNLAKLTEQVEITNSKIGEVKSALELHMGKRISTLQMRDTSYISLISLTAIQDRLK
jgi:hypothetical protein